MATDLYEALGLSRNASDSEIKKAYRRLAREYHPDVNKSAGADTRFKEVQKAYEILSDPKKRSNYDQFGVTDDAPDQGGFGGFGGFGNVEDIFDSIFGGGGGRRSQSSGTQKGEDLRYDLEISLEDAAKGISKPIEIFHMAHCSRCSGSGAQPGTSKGQCNQCKGAGQVRTVQRTMLGSFTQVMTCPTCNGSGSMIKNPCLLCQGRGVEKVKKSLTVDIPPGVDTGTRLRISGEGNCGTSGGRSGDLYVFITVKNHKYFQRDGNDIMVEIQIPVSDAILGTEIDVPTLEGSATVKIPAGTQPNTTFRLRGKGVAALRGHGKGDQMVVVKVEIPTRLGTKERDLITEFAKLTRSTSKAKSLFDNVRNWF